ncbi:MAG TPA: glutathione S-transferase N-terminal domain-containing protein [Steroidobacteraceae bacterium]|nr:glutathione S-transferase N-terminal domain-containing protein [Steroidobacteraceae bacterium]
MSAADDNVRLYELALQDGRSASPFVWRIRYALAHKGIAFSTVYLGFTEIPRVLGGKFKTVPILEHGQSALSESWDIAEYLDRAFPRLPPLFNTPAELALVKFMDAWFIGEVLRKMFRVYVKDVHDAARPEDRPYFRESREKNMKGRTLESFTADRAAHLPAIRAALAPLRAHLKKFPFLGGSAPNFADYIALGGFYWAASAGTLPLLERDDSLRDWLERGFNLYGGIAREPGIAPLFE